MQAYRDYEPAVVVAADAPPKNDHDRHTRRRHQRGAAHASTTSSSSDVDDTDSGDDGVPPTRPVGAAATELARHLPELVVHLQALRVEMEKSARVYEAITNGTTFRKDPASGFSSATTASDERGSLFTPLGDGYGYGYGHGLGDSAQSVSSTTSSAMSSPMRMSHLRPRPSLRLSASHHGTATTALVDYTVMWLHGECGISLRTFASNKMGAQIAVLQQADGVTTGISTCRLGDQLLTINDDMVEDMAFRDIVHKLKTTRRPITLGFRTNPNVATSPTASASGSATGSTSGSGWPSTRAMGGGAGSSRGSQTGSTRGFPSAEDEMLAMMAQHQQHQQQQQQQQMYGYSGSSSVGSDAMLDRATESSMRSSAPTLLDDVELWCKEQEEMHSDLLVLVTETVLRCEQLQQENRDQLQTLMQLSEDPVGSNVANSSSSSDRLKGEELATGCSNGSTSSSSLSLSSLAPVASPQDALDSAASTEASPSSSFA